MFIEEETYPIHGPLKYDLELTSNNNKQSNPQRQKSHRKNENIRSRDSFDFRFIKFVYQTFWFQADSP